jgi:hypothetical protein
MFTELSLSNGARVFTERDLQAVLESLAGQRQLSNANYPAPPGFLMIEEEGRQYCVNVAQIVLVREVPSRPVAWQELDQPQR